MGVGKGKVKGRLGGRGRGECVWGVTMLYVDGHYVAARQIHCNRPARVAAIEFARPARTVRPADVYYTNSCVQASAVQVSAGKTTVSAWHASAGIAPGWPKGDARIERLAFAYRYLDPHSSVLKQHTPKFRMY